MATINVKATVSAPSVVNVQLIRADHLETANIFRGFFEFSLAVFSATFGSVITMTQPMTVHWVMLVVFAFFTVAFLHIFIGRVRPQGLMLNRMTRADEAYIEAFRRIG